MALAQIQRRYIPPTQAFCCPRAVRTDLPWGELLSWAYVNRMFRTVPFAIFNRNGEKVL